MIRQGHKYRDKRTGAHVIAFEAGDIASVREFDTDGQPCGGAYVALSEWLEPLPMKYFKGEVPA